jgi:translocation and assembly module TamB
VAEADLDFRIRDSQLAGQPLEGEGQAQLRGERLSVPVFRLASGANRMALQGRLAEEDSQIAFTLDAPQLAQLGQDFGGAVQASGTIRGTLAKPRIAAQWTASKLRVPGRLQVDASQGKAELAFDRAQAFLPLQAGVDASANGLRMGGNAVASISARTQFASAPAGPLQLALRAEGIDAGAMRGARLAIDAGGTTAKHDIRAVFEEGRQSWDMKAAGGLSRTGKEMRWQGSIGALDAKGGVNAKLASPAAVSISRQQLLLERFIVDTAGGRIAVERLARDADGVSSRGRIDRVALSALIAPLEPAPPLRTDLLLDADWDLRIGDTVSGSASVRRNSGDVTVVGPATAALGLQTLAATMRADGGRLSLQASVRGTRLGVMELQAGMELGRGLERWKVAAASPVSGRGRIDIPSIAWIAPLLSPSMVADGRLQSDIVIGGTPEAPELAGRLNGDSLRLTLADLGIDLRQGILQGEFSGGRLQLQRLSFKGGDGDVTVAGPIDFGTGAMAADLTLAARRFALLNRPDRRIVASGDSRIVLQDKRIRVNGGFTVDSGFIDLGRADRPQLSDDVVVVGRERKQAGKTVATVDVTIGLGDGIALKGRGLDAQLTGKLRVTGEPGERLQANGTLSIAKGSYTAYGRELTIEEGALRFTGNLNNPALDIVAMRRGQEVEAGVSVRGTVLAPRVTLVSEPTVPDAEKLSWLVLGHGLSGSSGEADLGALQSAAGALLSEGAAAGVQSRIASAFGLDTLSVGKSQDSLQQRIVTIGKQVSSRLYVSYQQGLESAGSVVQLRYILSKRLSLEAEAGMRSALSLFYNIAFD